MGTQGDRIFQVTAERGFPDPWLSFGDSLCDEAALSTELTRAIGNARKEPSDRNRSEVARVFEAKEANLRRCAPAHADQRNPDVRPAWNDGSAPHRQTASRDSRDVRRRP